MSVMFPSMEFFNALKDALAADPDATSAAEPSEAYCGFAIGDMLFVVEFDGRQCAAVVHGGNPLDLDFILSAPREVWDSFIAAIIGNADGSDGDLAKRIEQGAIEIRSEVDDGPQLASEALGFMQAFFDLAKRLDVKFS
jgi:hypothetical protein